MSSPGLEMDVLVMELVFGAERCHLNDCWDILHLHDDEGLYRPPSYSTDPRLATDVLLEMQKQGWAIWISSDTTHWTASFSRRTQSELCNGSSRRKSLAHAICEAAVLACR